MHNIKTTDVLDITDDCIVNFFTRFLCLYQDPLSHCGVRAVPLFLSFQSALIVRRWFSRSRNPLQQCPKRTIAHQSATSRISVHHCGFGGHHPAVRARHSLERDVRARHPVSFFLHATQCLGIHDGKRDVVMLIGSNLQLVPALWNTT